ncbi:hypothetical protein K458DRAFT_363052 [Lentithecium fluviatile CBS 122367]|uniref:Uncharacterized protein n=1 Tax=Lentithecium fluviatile CBS 122367 TaxID=1168545 RepID=A0A6G1J8B6_9PLEO|nr:hypothetical protein K458DRAFT_363052 [Lentithecium fluviatile CBS 122367]
METVTNAVNAASKAIWGEQNPNTTTDNETAGQEPISGLQGKGSVNEPFDQGNAPNQGNIADTTSASTANPTTNPKPYSTSAERATPNMSGPNDAEIPTNVNNAAAGGTPNPLENTEGTGVTGSSAQKYAPTGGDAVPSSASSNPGAAPSSGATPSQKQQGADRPTEEPSASGTAEDSPDAILAKRDPNDHSGEPMHMHDGSGKLPETQEGRRESKVGNPGGQEHGKEPKGTGDTWVKTSGVHADGGDFDATKPGAGREAERLLEEKGIHRDQKGAIDKPETAAAGTEDKGKVSKVEKIKEKLHIGGHKDK